jgi:hypothetical protein
LNIAFFGNRTFGKANNNCVSSFDGFFDLHAPILPWVKFFFVQPRLNPRFGAEFLIQLADGGFVIAGVAEENAERAVSHKDKGGMKKDEFIGMGFMSP